MSVTDVNAALFDRWYSLWCDRRRIDTRCIWLTRSEWNDLVADTKWPSYKRLADETLFGFRVLITDEPPVL